MSEFVTVWVLIDRVSCHLACDKILEFKEKFRFSVIAFSRGEVGVLFSWVWARRYVFAGIKTQ